MSDEVTKEETTEKKVGAKKYSLWAMVVSGLWIAILTILKGAGIVNLDVKEEIIPTGITLAAVFCPVYFSIIMDKVKDIIK